MNLEPQSRRDESDWQSLHGVVVDDLIARHGIEAVQRHRERIERAIRNVERQCLLLRGPDE